MPSFIHKVQKLNAPDRRKGPWAVKAGSEGALLIYRLANAFHHLPSISPSCEHIRNSGGKKAV